MIIWLASYPKSGNTLVRTILSSYLYTSDANFKFELLKYIKQFPSKFFFQKLGINIDDKIEMQKNYVAAQKLVNSYNPHNFLKTHSSYKLNYHYKFTDIQNTLGAIYIVRDPRNVLTSFSNYFEMDQEQSLNNMLSSSFHVGDKFENDTPTFVGSWSSNYNSWKSKELDGRCLLVKYEDLIKKKKETVIKILEFIAKLSKIELKLDTKKLDNSLNTTEFNYLQKLEKKHSFFESIPDSQTGKKINFFNLGPENKWENLLKADIRKKLENSFKKEMIELGYL